MRTKSQYWVFKDGKPTSLTKNDLKQIDKLLKKCTDNHNSEQEKQFQEMTNKHPELELDRSNFVIDLARYKRQYIAVLNPKGEKEVWVNCFCNDGNQDWKDNLIFVKDGGNCYFNVKMNLTRTILRPDRKRKSLTNTEKLHASPSLPPFPSNCPKTDKRAAAICQTAT